MKVNYRSFVSFISLTFVILTLGGCDKTREAFGLKRHQPDAFEAPVRKPLILPLTSQVLSPKPGIQNSALSDTSLQQAQHILNVQNINSSSPSTVEKSLIQLAYKAEQPDPIIRQTLNAETNQAPRDPTVIQSVLFWQKKTNKGHPIDPNQALRLKPKSLENSDDS